MNRICPKCQTLNPPTRDFSHINDGEQCKKVIGTYKLFGIIPMNRYCNAINDMDEYDDWIYVIDGQRVKKLNNDFFENRFVSENYVRKPIILQG